ncbi:MAG: hypothetical protein KGO48_00780 [Alphaproteobacteria bacterium]|nr:hypothetical protein [Alphaproteobacteria bacterium]
MRQRDRHRLPYRTAARGIVVWLTCALCMGAISLPPPPQRAAVPPNAGAIQENPAPTLAPGVQADLDRIARALEAANAGRNSPGENRRADANLDAQKQIAFWGMVIAVIGAFDVVVTAAGVVLVALTLRAIRRAAKAG